MQFMKSPKQIYPVTKQKTIERRIEGKETIIEGRVVVINNDKRIIDKLTKGLSNLELQLQAFKNSRDTFNIIQMQDTMIHVLYARDKVKDGVISNQDTIIQAQRYIINSKDTIITNQSFNLKRIKRQRNWSLLGNGILTGLLIIK